MREWLERPYRPNPASATNSSGACCHDRSSFYSQDRPKQTLQALSRVPPVCPCRWLVGEEDPREAALRRPVGRLDKAVNNYLDLHAGRMRRLRMHLAIVCSGRMTPFTQFHESFSGAR